eukprot:5242894-Pleurochrysis_carterae.AAC.5
MQRQASRSKKRESRSPVSATHAQQRRRSQLIQRRRCRGARRKERDGVASAARKTDASWPRKNRFNEALARA